MVPNTHHVLVKQKHYNKVEHKLRLSYTFCKSWSWTTWVEDLRNSRLNFLPGQEQIYFSRRTHFVFVLLTYIMVYVLSDINQTTMIVIKNALLLTFTLTLSERLFTMKLVCLSVLVGVIRLRRSLEMEEEPEEFIADRPFTFIISQTSSRFVVFAGRFCNPDLAGGQADKSHDELWASCVEAFV